MEDHIKMKIYELKHECINCAIKIPYTDHFKVA